MTAFAGRVLEGMRRSGLTLRGLCRQAGLDPSFFSKVLAGKRSPPSEEQVLRRIARTLDLDAVELIISAGRLPEDWQAAVWRDPSLLRRLSAVMGSTFAAPKASSPPAASLRAPQPMSEELL